MKFRLVVTLTCLALSSSPTFAQTNFDEANPDEFQADQSSNGSVEARKQACRRQTRQIDDPQERRQAIRECRRELRGSIAEAPMERGNASDFATDDTVTYSTVPRSNYMGNRPIQNDDYSEDEDSGRYGDEWMRPSPEGPNPFTEGSGGPESYPWSYEENGPPVSDNRYESNNDGSLASRRDLRIERLEQRLNEIENLLRQVLANQAPPSEPLMSRQ